MYLNGCKQQQLHIPASHFWQSLHALGNCEKRPAILIDKYYPIACKQFNADQSRGIRLRFFPVKSSRVLWGPPTLTRLLSAPLFISFPVLIVSKSQRHRGSKTQARVLSVPKRYISTKMAVRNKSARTRDEYTSRPKLTLSRPSDSKKRVCWPRKIL